MMKTKVRWLLMTAALAGLASGCKNARPVAKPIAETPRSTSFPHSKHEGVAECADCHGDTIASKKLGAAPLPGTAKCEECHDAKAADVPGQAIRDLKAKPAGDYQLTFNHADHLARIKEKNACTVCHKALPEPGTTRNWSPPMEACTSCHYHQKEVAEARCQPCHVSLRAFPLKPIEALAGFSHDKNFTLAHRDLAKDSAATCAQCHDQTYCAACHATTTNPVRPEIRFPEKVEANFIHRGDYVSRHTIEATADPASCRKCHGSYFCESCHQVQGVARQSASVNPHLPQSHLQPGWTSREKHGLAARQNIVSCAGCHDQGAASICVTCHRVGGIGGSPHPPGFVTQHKQSDIAGNAMCRICHT
jgi:hypothetical protein